jgi:hypothetical protein
LKQSLKRFFIIREIIRFYRNSYRPNWQKINFSKLGLVSRDHKIKKRILVITGGGGYSAAKQIESLLAVALKLRGASVDVLLCDGVLPGCFQTTIDWDQNERVFSKTGTSKFNCYSCFKYAHKTYESLGVNVIKLSDLLSREEMDQTAEFANKIDIDDIKSYSVQNVQIGEHAYAGALRFYATAKLIDEHSEKVLRRYFNAALRAYKGANNLFLRSKTYSHVLLHHGIYIPQGVFAETARTNNLDITTWHVAYREKTFLFSHGGTYHKTMMSEPKDSWDGFDFTKEKRQLIIDYLQSRWSGTNDWISFSRQFSDQLSDQETDIKYSLKKRYDASILLLTNVMWDAQLHYPANAFPSMLDWILSTIEFFKLKPNLELIIRIHPAEMSGTLPSRQLVVDEIKKHFDHIPNNIKIIKPNDPVNTYSLAKKCDTAIIFGTKTGVELTSMGIPTIVAGEAWVRGKGFTVDVDSPEGYLDELNKLPLKQRLSPDVREKALKYAYHFFFRRMIPLNIVKKSKGHETFNYAFDNIQDLEPGSDKGLDVICEGILTGNQYIYENY